MRTNEKDEKIISEIKKNKNVEQNLKELISRHAPLFHGIINKYIPSDCSFLHKEDVARDIGFYFFDFANKYDEGKNTKFSTHLANQVRWMCLNLYNNNKKRQSIQIDDIEKSNVFKSKSNVVEEVSKKEMFASIIREIESCKDKRIRKIFLMRYINGKSNKVTPWRKISKSLDLSIQGCINLHNGFIGKLQKKGVIKDV